MSTANPNLRSIRILMLHGFTQNPDLFYAKTRALHKALTKTLPPSRYQLQLSYLVAPHKLAPADIPGYEPPPSDDQAPEDPEAYGWWRRKDHPVKGGEGTEIVYEGLEVGMERIAQCVREEGPFGGVVGFSQGAACAAMVASLLEGVGRKTAFEAAEKRGGIHYPASFLEGEGDAKGVNGLVQGPLRFAVCYSGFAAPGTKYAAFYEPKIRTPVLHVLGQLDVVVEEARGRTLVAACEGGEERVVMHPGGHFVPSQKAWLDAVVGFIKNSIEDTKEVPQKQKEANVEDMDVPF